MSESLTEPEPDVVQERSGDLVADWWSGETTGQPLYMRLRKIDPSQLQDALDGLPDDDGPQAVPTPDRAPPRAADMPEVQALRAHLQDHKTPFDTIDRWFRAITMMTQALDGKRPLQWTADDVARRCIQQAGEQGGSIWSTLEAVREFWRRHRIGSRSLFSWQSPADEVLVQPGCYPLEYYGHLTNDIVGQPFHEIYPGFSEWLGAWPDD